MRIPLIVNATPLTWNHISNRYCAHATWNRRYYRNTLPGNGYLAFRQVFSNGASGAETGWKYSCALP